jgi:hypothetical protein
VTTLFVSFSNIFGYADMRICGYADLIFHLQLTEELIRVRIWVLLLDHR